MFYGEIFSKAWKILWKHKILWIFGILAGCVNSGTSNFNFNFNSSNIQTNPAPGNPSTPNIPDIPGLPSTQEMLRIWDQINHQVTTVPIWGWVALIAVLVLFSLFIYALGTMGRIGTIEGSWQADEGKVKLQFGELWNDSDASFWRMVLLDLLLFGISLVLALLVIVPFVGFTAAAGGFGALASLALLVPLMCLCIPVSWIVGMYLEQARVALVGEKLGVIASLTRAWAIIRAHPGEVIITGILVGIGSAIVSFIISLPFLLVMVPIIFGLAAGTNSNLLIGSIAVTVIGMLIYIPILIVLRGVMAAYINALWTLLFRRLTGRLPAASTPQPAASSLSEPSAFS
jgi:hypothetical protein